MSEYTVIDEDRDCSGITVEMSVMTTRHLRTEASYKLSKVTYNSEFFPNLDPGIVKIKGIVSYYSLRDEEYLSKIVGVNTEWIMKDIQDYMGMYTDNPDILDQPWIIFYYTKGYLDSFGKFIPLPLDEFLDHTTELSD